MLKAALNNDKAILNFEQEHGCKVGESVRFQMHARIMLQAVNAVQEQP